MPPKRDPNAPKPPQSPLKFLLGGTTVLVWTVDRGVRAPWPARILTTRELLDNRELVRFHTNSLSYLSRYCYGRFQSQLQAKQLHVSQDHTWAVANKVIEPFPTDPRTCVELYKKYSAERTFAPPYTAEVFRAGWLEAAQNVCGDDFSLDACYDEDGEVAEVDVLRPSLPLAAPESAECNRDADAAAAAASSGSSGTPSAPPPHSAATLAMQWRLASYVGPINYPFPGRPEVYSRFSLLSRPLRSDTMVRLRDRRLVNLYEFVVPEGVPLPDLDQDGAEHRREHRQDETTRDRRHRDHPLLPVPENHPLRHASMLRTTAATREHRHRFFGYSGPRVEWWIPQPDARGWLRTSHWA